MRQHSGWLSGYSNCGPLTVDADMHRSGYYDDGRLSPRVLATLGPEIFHHWEEARDQAILDFYLAPG